MDSTTYRAVLTVLAAIGSGLIISLLLRVLSFFHLFFIQPCRISRYQRNPAATQQATKAWALVTGASDGIGYGFASDLARRGFNVVLHGRNPSKLDEKLAALKRRFPQIEFRTAIADAADARNLNDLVDGLAAEMGTLPGPLTVLINNAGGIPFGEFLPTFEEMDGRQIGGVIDLNARFPTLLSHALLPLLKRNGPALILHMGSGSSDIPIPYIAVYGGTKAYLKALSRAMAVELDIAGDKDRIEWLGIQTGNVTGTSGRPSNESLFKPSPEVYARHALNRVGCGSPWVWAYWPHALQGAFLTFVLPERLVTNFAKDMMSQLKAELARSK